VRHNQLDPERRNAARKLFSGALRSYAAAALVVAAAGAMNGMGYSVILIVLLALGLALLSFKVKPPRDEH
jgi:hypothetical protein